MFGLVRFIFIQQTLIEQLLSQTDPRNHNQISHLQGKEKIQKKKGFFLTFTVATLTNAAATSAWFVDVAATGNCSLLHASFQNSLRETHLCPRADILITSPPMSSAGEEACAQNKEAPTVGCCRTSRVDKRDLRVAPGCVGQTTPAARRKWNHYCSSSFFLKRTSMRKKAGIKNIQLNAAVAHTLLRMMQFTSWMGAAKVLGRAKPFLHPAD